MYQNLKLEKGLYHLTNKSFVQALEALDPSAQYADTPLAGLDAYERQLKRFDIRISGAQCDRVEKFFTSTESAVLFYIRTSFRVRRRKTFSNPYLLTTCASVNTLCTE